jgi:hypothetical protein
MGSGVPSWSKGSLEVHVDDGVPLIFSHVGKHPVAQNAGVVDNCVKTPEGFDCGINYALCAVPVGDVVTIDNRLAAGGDDFFDDLVGGRDIVAGSVSCAT